ncbi:MAG: pilus assembly protein PilM [Candidatus Omnitrophica bacterium]|nr:pilus assembly protein PilM [Candidatus Omnitrophota bacterium]
MTSTMVFHINEGTIKFLQVTGAQKKTITAFDVIAIKDLTDAQISGQLAALVKQQGLKCREARVIVLVPRARLILRHMTLPSHKESELRAMIDLQVVNHIPYAREEVEIDFQILTKTPDGYAKIVAAIIPREEAMRYWNIFTGAQIPVHCVTISSVGLWLLYKLQQDAPEQLGGIIELDANHSEICLCHKTHWLRSREIPVGLTQIQQDGNGGEFLKQLELTQGNTEGAAGGVLYIVSTAGQTDVLSIDMAKDQDLAVKEINLARSFSVAKNMFGSRRLMAEVSWASLAGIAFGPYPPPVDLTPQIIRQQKRQKALRRETVVLGIWFAAALITSALALGIGLLKKNIQSGQIEKNFKAVKPEADMVERQMRQVRDIEQTFKRRLIFAGLVQEINRLLPPRLSLVSLSISDGNILTFQGISSRPGDINQLQKDMVDSPFFATVNLDYVNKRVTQDGEVNYFKITCAIKPVKGTDEKTE